MRLCFPKYVFLPDINYSGLREESATPSAYRIIPSKCNQGLNLLSFVVLKRELWTIPSVGLPKYTTSDITYKMIAWDIVYYILPDLQIEPDFNLKGFVMVYEIKNDIYLTMTI